MSVRVRFAPSPTGYLHIGAARSALFNWLYARKTGGKFLLRIEDTDLQRSTGESTRSIIAGLEWLGLDYDEDLVFQSANAPRHRDAANRLVEEGKAYRDFTPKEHKIQTMPKLMVKALALFVPILRDVDEMSYEFDKPFVMDHSRFERAFGMKATPLREAIQSTVAWFRANPKTA
jgi:glutamyl-tRNA synthetase